MSLIQMLCKEGPLNTITKKLTICAINHKRWYNFSTRHSKETLLQGNTKDVEKYRYFSCIKNPKNWCSDLMFPYSSF